MQPTTMLRTGAVLGALGVLAGAFGAHALEGELAPRDLEVWDTAVRYQLWHALALCLCAALDARGRAVRHAARAFCAGIALFSGSLYVLVLADLRFLGAVTPVGGVLLIAGWVLLAAGAGPAAATRH